VNRTDILKAFCPQVKTLLVCLVCSVIVAGCRGGQLAQIRPVRAVYHEVQRGQTLWSIARKYNVDMNVLARVNKLPDASMLQIGQRLYIPGATQRRHVVSQCPCPTKDTDSAPRQHPVGATATANRMAAAERHRVESAVGSDAFIWPVQGTVTRNFKQGGKHRHDGIDIAAPKGTPIMAAASGKVIFSDWGPGGYGRIVILRHDADLVTVYAHNHQNLVKVGQQVQRGERIATVGRSGRATGYHLHFEIRRKTVPVPPYSYLPHDRQLVRLERR
jgi:murein DD-endopeptidase MepM/ murein hydrolase activator NlpD